eukprot:Hpha_TRINITY_DN35807_c0_g1::TRINITY_DN35807_c0_g1_i1::g.84982::m.84982/K14026/SEL1, SEL1L; SEL1 protein
MIPHAVLVPLAIAAWQSFPGHYIPTQIIASSGSVGSVEEAQAACQPPQCVALALRDGGAKEGGLKVYYSGEAAVSRGRAEGWTAWVFVPEDPAGWHEEAAGLLGRGEEGARRAAGLLRLAADRGHTESHFLLGVLYATGVGVPVSEPRAVFHYGWAAAGGDENAALALMHRHTHGAGVLRSCPDVVRHLHAVAKSATSLTQENATASANSAMAAARVHARLREGSDPSVDWTKAEDFLRYLEHTNAVHGVEAHDSVLMGYAHQWGALGMEKKPALAEGSFERAAEQGLAAGHAGLGQFLLLEGDDSDRLERARKSFYEGALLGHGVSLNGLAWATAKGIGGSRNETRARDLFRLAAERGTPEALYNLGLCQLSGIGGDINEDEAVANFRAAARAGLVQASWTLGILQLHHRAMGGLEPSCAEAARYLRSVTEGRGPAARFLGTALHSFSIGDDGPALMNFLLAAELGAELAHSNAGYMLDLQLGVDEVGFHKPEGKESEEVAAALAFRLQVAAAEGGSSAAAVRLGDHYYYGRGVGEDVEKARKNYEVAARAGEGEGMYSIGWMVENGVGGERNLTQALRIYRRVGRSHKTSDQWVSFIAEAVACVRNLHIPPDLLPALPILRLYPALLVTSLIVFASFIFSI